MLRTGLTLEGFLVRCVATVQATETPGVRALSAADVDVLATLAVWHCGGGVD